MGDRFRFRLASVLSVAMAFYSALFSRQALAFEMDLATGLLGIEWLAWLPVLGFAVAGGAAAIRNGRLAAVALVFAVLAFFVAHWRHVFDVPLGFLLVCGVTIGALFLMPSEERRWR